jgi:uncharacterized YigZ family protein
MISLRMPSAHGQAEIEIKKSRFIADVWPVYTEAQALEYLAQARTAQRKADHHVYAYRLEHDLQVVRFSDDGEPGGTAGRPILEVIQGEGMDRILVVVTRYFGGTLLGSGGLARAYSQAAREGIRAAGILEQRAMIHCRFRVPYDHSGRVEYYLSQGPYVISDIDYQDDVTYIVFIPPDQITEAVEDLAEMTGGRSAFSTGETIFLPIKT